MQIINVDLIPGKVMPILHASQFDVGRSLGVKLYNGGAVYDLTGAEVVSVSVRKPDGNIVTEALTNSGGNELEIITTEQMTACAGASLCEIKIEDSGDVIGSANFVLEVEEDPLDGGIASQSEINNLATQVADLVSEQYDSANVIFDAVPTAGHGNGYTVTSEGIKDALDAINNPAASAVSYDNTASGLAATNVQDALDEAVDVFNDNFADAYDPTATYNKGDKCVYNNLLYECNDDGVTGTWDGSKWDSLTVASMTDNNLPHFSGTPTAGTTAEAVNTLNLALGQLPSEIRCGIGNYSGLKGGGHANRVNVPITFSTAMTGTQYAVFIVVSDAYSDYPYVQGYCFGGSRTVNGFTATILSMSSDAVTEINGSFYWIAVRFI